MAGLLLALIVVGLGLIRLFREIAPAWAMTLALATLAFLTISGPLLIIQLHGDDLLTPPGGFGVGPGYLIYWLACLLASIIPLGLMYGLPLSAALGEPFRRSPWRWTEWVGVITPGFLLLTFDYIFLGQGLPASPVEWAAVCGLVVGWFMTVGLLSRLIVAKVGPSWSRWLGDQCSASGSIPVEASPSSTR